MLVNLNSSEILEGEIERDRLADQIERTSDILNSEHSDYTSILRKFVYILQKYIEDTYDPINVFLREKIQQIFKITSIAHRKSFP